MNILYPAYMNTNIEIIILKCMNTFQIECTNTIALYKKYRLNCTFSLLRLIQFLDKRTTHLFLVKFSLFTIIYFLIHDGDRFFVLIFL